MFKRKIVGAASVATVAMLSFASVAAAAVVNVDGGTWNHGRDNSHVWSDYHHPARDHKTSVVNGKGNFATSGWVSPDQWAKSSTFSTWFGNKSFYDVR